MKTATTQKMAKNLSSIFSQETKTKTNKNAKTLVDNATKKPLIENTKDGLIVNESVNGKKLQRILTPLQETKKDLKNAVNKKRNSLAYNLKLIKDDCRNESEKYIKELATKYEIKVNGKELFILLSSPNNYLPYLTESQKVKFTEDRLNFTPSIIIEAISKYYKNTAKNSL